MSHALFPNRTPSVRVTRQQYPEQWAWWDACNWQMMVEDKSDGGLLLNSTRGNEFSSSTATAQEASTRVGVEHFLTQALYQHLHPGKAARSRANTGQVASDKELAAFVSQQRRKMPRLAL
jgi:hypothetical protein